MSLRVLATAIALLLPLFVQCLVPAGARACTCATPTPWRMTIAPVEGSVAPRNTRIWVTFSQATMPGGPDVALLDQAGTRVALTSTVFTKSSKWLFRMRVLAPAEPLAPDARYTIHVRDANGELALPAQTFMTSAAVDDAAPAVPFAESVQYLPGIRGSTCGPASTLSVALAADTWIAIRAVDVGEGVAFDPADPLGAVEDIFLDAPMADLHSGPCGGSASSPFGVMQLGSFDLAGNFSGWGPKVRFDPEPADTCSVRAVGARSRESSAPLLALVLLALLVLIRRNFLPARASEPREGGPTWPRRARRDAG